MVPWWGWRGGNIWGHMRGVHTFIMRENIVEALEILRWTLKFSKTNQWPPTGGPCWSFYEVFISFIHVWQTEYSSYKLPSIQTLTPPCIQMRYLIGRVLLINCTAWISATSPSPYFLFRGIFSFSNQGGAGKFYREEPCHLLLQPRQTCPIETNPR